MNASTWSSSSCSPRWTALTSDSCFQSRRGQNQGLFHESIGDCWKDILLFLCLSSRFVAPVLVELYFQWADMTCGIGIVFYHMTVYSSSKYYQRYSCIVKSRQLLDLMLSHPGYCLLFYRRWYGLGMQCHMRRLCSGLRHLRERRGNWNRHRIMYLEIFSYILMELWLYSFLACFAGRIMEYNWSDIHMPI